MYKNNMLKHKPGGELLRLVKLRKSNSNTFVKVDRFGNPKIKIMKTSFEKQEYNKNYSNEDNVVEIFKNLGFNDININTSTTNGMSHYVRVNDFEILNEMKLYSDMFIFDGQTDITVRISDHISNLDTICGGVSGNKMNLNAFKKLIETGAISPKN